MQCQIRKLRPEDPDSLSRIYRDSITELGHERYSPEQVKAWASFADDAQEFRAWLAEAATFVAVNEDGEHLGFGGLQSPGRISSLFVAPRYQRSGVASRLLERLLTEARQRGVSVLTTEASEFSKPLFQRYGFTETGVEKTEFKGVGFRRYSMRVSI